MTAKPMFHIAWSHKPKDLPDVGGAKKCENAKCPAPDFETGFGMAGGGYGTYEYCEVCGKIVSKTEED